MVTLLGNGKVSAGSRLKVGLPLYTEDVTQEIPGPNTSYPTAGVFYFSGIEEVVKDSKADDLPFAIGIYGSRVIGA